MLDMISFLSTKTGQNETATPPPSPTTTTAPREKKNILKKKCCKIQIKTSSIKEFYVLFLSNMNGTKSRKL